MLRTSFLTARRTIYRAAVMAGILIPVTIFALTHTVQFGGSTGFAYSPKSFTATMGTPKIATERTTLFQIALDRGETFIRIDVSQPEFFSIKIFSALGGELATIPTLLKTPGAYRISLPKLPKGLYFARLIGKGAILTKSFAIAE